MKIKFGKLKKILLITNNFDHNSSNQRARKLADRSLIFEELGWQTIPLVFDEYKKTAPVYNGKTINSCGYVRYLFSRLLFYIKKIVRRVIRLNELPLFDILYMYIKVFVVIRKENPDIVITMCSPFMFHVVGLLIKYTTGVLWVAEFRDPWRINLNKFPFGPTVVHSFLEKKTVEKADLVVWNYGVQIPDGYFSEVYPNVDSGKYVQLPAPGFEGINSEKYKDVSTKKNNVFTITYAGNFYPSLTPVNFVKSLRIAIDQGYVVSKDIRINFLGGWNKHFTEIVERNGLSDIVLYLGRVSHEKCLEYLYSSDVNLLIVRTLKMDALNIPSKVNDYVLASRPVLALVYSDWAVDKFIQNNNLGITCSPDDLNAIAMTLGELYSKYKTNDLNKLKNEALLKSFDTTKVIDSYSIHLNNLLKNQ